MMNMFSAPSKNVYIESFKMSDYPAKLRYEVKVSTMSFYSEISYDSIACWADVLMNLNNDKQKFQELISLIIAWDAMRFMALGGEAVLLCEGLFIGEKNRKFWQECFLNQFGEWRYRNKFYYTNMEYPCITNPADKLEISIKGSLNSVQCEKIKEEERWLIANGGGKDSLAGMLLLMGADIQFDLYEGYLPMGADWETQKKLLSDLRNSVCNERNSLVSVHIKDDFYNRDDSYFYQSGVETKHFKTDFAVGHTANYIGYFPLIVYHGFKYVWFNIEASADRVMAIWNDEEINHQWCKSTRYQDISREIFVSLAGSDRFEGFTSTIRGLHDTSIYSIVSNDKESLARSHSCNISKPWCGECPKCCFSYLMMSAVIDEDFAKKTMSVTSNLFNSSNNQKNWQSLLDKEYIAWECVPSHAECLVALRKCVDKGYASNLKKYLKDEKHLDELAFRKIEWNKMPNVLRKSVLNKIHQSNNVVFNDVIVIGAGQAGLGMSYLLKENKINHAILEADRIGNSWANRWDSFQLNTPNKTVSLPGFEWTKDEGQGFMTHLETREYLKEYAKKFDLPVIKNSRVLKVEKSDNLFYLTLTTGVMICKNVIIATGEYANVKTPEFSETIKNKVKILHSRDYRNKTQISGKNVLIIGGGQSGAQIAEELNSEGHRVYWSISSRPSNIRHLRGKDFMEWWDIGGIIQKHIDEYPDDIKKDKNKLRALRDMEFPLVSGLGNDGLGHSISLQNLAESGVTLLDKMVDNYEENLIFGDNIQLSVEKSIKGTKEQYEILNDIADIYYQDKVEPECDNTPFIPNEILSDWKYEHKINRLNIVENEIGTIICATGYKKDWSWIDIPGTFDDHGYPIGNHSKSIIDGLYFLGIFNIPRLSTTCLCNGGRDAKDILTILQL